MDKYYIFAGKEGCSWSEMTFLGKCRTLKDAKKHIKEYETEILKQPTDGKTLTQVALLRWHDIKLKELKIKCPARTIV